MSDPVLHNTLRPRRAALGLSQQALADRVGVSRQAIVAIESGRQVPATSLALDLSAALGCTVEDLFRRAPADWLAVHLAPSTPGSAEGSRVALGEVEGRWVAHRLPVGAARGADGLLAEGGSSVARPLADPARLARSVLVAGCAPLLGTLSARVEGRFADARLTWIAANSHRSLDLLAGGYVHAAGLHLGAAPCGDDHERIVRNAFPGRSMLVVNVTRWRQGLLLAPGNPLGIRSPDDLARPGLRFARREEGSGAHEVTARALGERPVPDGPIAGGHTEVAQLVRSGAADAGIAIEAAALAAGLAFVPLTEERFDLVLPAAGADRPPVSRVLDALGDAAFRLEATHVPGYDTALAGQVTTLGAA